METEALENMVEEYRELEREMREKNLIPNLPHVKALFLGWFDPLKGAIEAEQKSKRSKKHKAAFAPHIDSLPAAKMAVIVMHKLMGLVSMEYHHAGCVLLVDAAVQIGMAVEQEVHHMTTSSLLVYQLKGGVISGQESGKECIGLRFEFFKRLFWHFFLRFLCKNATIYNNFFE